jgi:hypothetical protein
MNVCFITLVISSPTHHKDQNRLLYPARKIILFSLIVLSTVVLAISFPVADSSDRAVKGVGLRSLAC